MQQCEIHGFAS